MGNLPSAVVLAIDPKVTPNDNLPFISTVRDIVGGVLTLGVVVSVAALVVAAIILVWGKVSKSSMAAQVGTSVLLWVLVGASIIGSASGLIAWAADIKLF